MIIKYIEKPFALFDLITSLYNQNKSIGSSDPQNSSDLSENNVILQKNLNI